MRVQRSVILIGVIGVGLSACAATPSSTYQAQLKPVEYEVDLEKINIVDARARVRGVRVVWVNPPVKQVEIED